jgi:hypothetical protein
MPTSNAGSGCVRASAVEGGGSMGVDGAARAREANGRCAHADLPLEFYTRSA